MGMFDEIRCHAPLPDDGACADTCFQTKSFPAPCLQRYFITEAGRLLDALGHDLEPDGYINFYTSSAFETMPAKPERHEWIEYRARFSEGQLRKIVRVREEGAARIYYGLASFRWYEAPSFLFGDTNEPSSE